MSPTMPRGRPWLRATVPLVAALLGLPERTVVASDAVSLAAPPRALPVVLVHGPPPRLELRPAQGEAGPKTTLLGHVECGFEIECPGASTVACRLRVVAAPAPTRSGLGPARALRAREGPSAGLAAEPVRASWRVTWTGALVGSGDGTLGEPRVPDLEFGGLVAPKGGALCVRLEIDFACPASALAGDRAYSISLEASCVGLPTSHVPSPTPLGPSDARSTPAASPADLVPASHRTTRRFWGRRPVRPWPTSAAPRRPSTLPFPEVRAR